MYEIIVDGFTVGIMELTTADVIALASDPDIRIKKVSNN